MTDTELVPQPHGGALRKGGGRAGHKNKILSAIRDALYVETTEDGKPAVSGVIPALILKAEEGDVRAIELCLQYGIGKPTERVEVSGGGTPVLLAPFLASISDERIERELKELEDE